MTDQKQFAKELGELCRKYELTGCVFASEDKDGKLIGYHCIEREGLGFDIKTMMQSTVNASRMYQACREQTFKMMDRV